ncbi:sigma-70 family RNA polymerase sigma factor [Kribbella sp. NPDC059898]|uniref:sigma-70 family RNA polymerase sigma factor n=1 Tax=Kribbella sp. NPDC059898 TaxID=3346995 RepID=UPI0036671437
MELLARARDGDADAFGELVAPYRRELEVHCYRLLGSLQDAEEALQETLLSAWQSLGAFEGRSSVRTWLYRIATNRSLDLLRGAGRRTPPGTPLRVEPPPPSRQGEITWLQPFPDDLLGVADPAPGPEAVIEARDATTLAFVTALQRLPARQRAVLILRDVLGYRAAEVADLLDATEESVTSALKRARATLATDASADRPPAPPPLPLSAEEEQLVSDWMEAFQAFDIQRLVALLTDDAWIKMPPLPWEYQGREACERFFNTMAGSPGGHRRLVPTRANGQPAYGSYTLDTTTGIWRANGFFVLTLAGDRIHEIIRFEIPLMARFGLPRTLPQ